MATNGEVIKAICEMHDKETIAAAAIISIAFLLSTTSKIPPHLANDVALELLSEILDKRGIEINAIVNEKA